MRSQPDHLLTAHSLDYIADRTSVYKLYSVLAFMKLNVKKLMFIFVFTSPNNIAKISTHSQQSLLRHIGKNCQKISPI